MNLGACNARNLGLNHSKYDYVMFLDSDDYLLDGAIPFDLKDEKIFDLLIGDFLYEKNNIKSNSERNLNTVTPLEFFDLWINGNFIPPCSVIWRKEFLIKIGSWDVNIKRNQDGEIVLRALLYNPSICFIKQKIGVYVQHEDLNRVSKRKGEEIIVGDIRIFENLFSLAKSRAIIIDSITLSFAKAWYSIAYEAYYLGYDNLGEKALSRARQFGLMGHLGSMRHKIMASIFGLKIKMYLSRKFFELRNL